VIGTCRPEQVRRNSGSKPGDAIVLTKPIGVGIYSAAIKKGELGGAGYAEMLATTTLLNRIGGELSNDSAVHAITDVTGFGLLGHGLELAHGSNLSIVIDADTVPLLSEAAALAQRGFITGASKRNRESYGASVRLPAGFPEWRRDLLADPQTSGGLLIACTPDRANAILGDIIGAGFAAARIIGQTQAGAPEIQVRSG
jgi:selenide,water dikinase